MKICIDCRGLTTMTRCPGCTRKHNRNRGTTTSRGYGHTWQQASQQCIRNQPWCTSCSHPGSPTNPLTADHITPKSAGGTDQQSNLQTLCRKCNSQKHNR